MLFYRNCNLTCGRAPIIVENMGLYTPLEISSIVDNKLDSSMAAALRGISRRLPRPGPRSFILRSHEYYLRAIISFPRTPTHCKFEMIANIETAKDVEASELLSQLRDQSLGPSTVRRLVGDLTAVLAKHLLEIPQLSEKVAVVVILRSGLAMVDPFLAAFPENCDTVTYHLGLFREKESLRPIEYYNRLPMKSPKIKRAYILDPLVATGGTAKAAIDILK